jgi:hypothetical protein
MPKRFIGDVGTRTGDWFFTMTMLNSPAVWSGGVRRFSRDEFTLPNFGRVGCEVRAAGEGSGNTVMPPLANKPQLRPHRA